MSAKSFEASKEKFESLVALVMAEAKIPGLSIALVKEDQIIYARGFGARSLVDNLPASPNTLCGIGSCTKPFTALAIMQLAEQGKISLHDPVKKYLPFRLGSKDNPITIHHLLSHSSGIPDLGTAMLLIGRMNEIYDKMIPASSKEDFWLFINNASDEIAAKPGKRYFYLNEGYTILGEIIEKVSRLKYEDYVKTRILKPLKMTRSTFSKEEFEKDSDTMTTVATSSDEKVFHRFPFHRLVYAAGGLISSVRELANFLIANMNLGVFEDTKLLGGAHLKEMHKLQIETRLIHTNLGFNGKEGYGYGWAVVKDFLGYKLVRHAGSTAVSSAHLSFMPDLKIGVAAVANTGAPPEPLFLSALAILMGKDPMKEIPLFEREKRLGLLTGKYETYKGIIRISIVKKGGLLYAEVKEKYMEASYPLIPETDKIEDHRFHIISETGDKIPIEFKVDHSGRVDLYYERNRFHKVSP